MKITCRICQIQQGEFFTLDSEVFIDGLDQKLLEIYNKCLQLEAKLQDSLPQVVCLECFSQLKELYEFQLKASKSDLELRESLNVSGPNLLKEVVSVTPDIVKNELEEEDDNNEALDNVNEFITTDNATNGDFEKLLDYEYQQIEEVNLEENDDDNMIEHEDDEEDLEDTDILFELYCKNDAFVERYQSETSQESFEPEENVKNNTQTEFNEEDSSVVNIINPMALDVNLPFALTSNNVDMPLTSPEPAIEITRLQLPVEPSTVQKISMESFVESRKWACPDCGRRYISEETLEQHRQLHIPVKNSQCEVCNSSFTTLYDYREHMKTHGEERKFSCEFCDKTFTTRANLKAHLYCHTNLRPFKCEVCGKTFQQKSILKTHMTLHMGKPFECSLCNRRFSRSAHLNIHMRQHNNIRPYKCPQCPCSYMQKSHLDRHISSSHLGVRYQCTICGKMYTKMPSLKAHIRDVHSDNAAVVLYNCQICDLEFSKQKGLYYHLKSKHPEYQKLKA